MKEEEVNALYDGVVRNANAWVAKTLRAVLCNAAATEADREADYARKQYDQHVRAAANWKAAELATRAYADQQREEAARAARESTCDLSK